LSTAAAETGHLHSRGLHNDFDPVSLMETVFPRLFQARKLKDCLVYQKYGGRKIVFFSRMNRKSGSRVSRTGGRKKASPLCRGWPVGRRQRPDIKRRRKGHFGESVAGEVSAGFQEQPWNGCAVCHSENHIAFFVVNRQFKFCRQEN
jgi:hypothetical protein